MWTTTYRYFGSQFHMNDVDPVAFGARVRELRVLLGLSQSQLAKEAGHSQTNVGWIEKGRIKKPKKVALDFAEALRTTPDWLLYARGPKLIGPRILTQDEVGGLYAGLSLDERARFSELLTKADAAARKERKGA